MKICPKCNTQYESEMVFCLQDGMPLIFADSTAKTLVMPDISTKYARPQIKDTSPIFGNPPKSRSDLIVSVIFGTLIILSVLVLAWNYNFFSKNDTASVTNSNKIETVPAAPSDLRKYNETFYLGLKTRLQTYSKANNLKPLSDAVLPKDSIEIRLYLFAGFYAPIYKGFAVDDSVLVIKRDNTTWSGKIIRNVIKSNSAEEKLTTSLNQPTSGWENLWQQMQNIGVFAPPTLSENSIKSDSSLFVIESKENEKYNYSYFHIPKESSAIDEEKRIASIFNLIAQEFEISDLKAS